MIRKIHGDKIVFLLYDGVQNSVFYSQVLMPLVTLLEEQPNCIITLISFEKKSLSQKFLQPICSAHERIHLVIQKKPPFIGKITLRLGAWQFSRYLKRLCATHVIARGPFAGWIGLKSVGNRLPVTIQSRGLAAEEFRFVMGQCEKSGLYAWLRRLFTWIRYKQYRQIENEVYCRKNLKNFSIESVSPALKVYLQKNFQADPNQIVITSYDIPPTVPSNKVTRWRSEMRVALGIPSASYVYCYTGSARPWQCVDEMIAYFVTKHKQNNCSFFLILSSDKELFEKKLQQAGLSDGCYFVFSIHPGDTYRYLSAADAGLLFRESDLVNWVSRPTKMLEYQSLGLPIIHNYTIAWLAEKM